MADQCRASCFMLGSVQSLTARDTNSVLIRCWHMQGSAADVCKAAMVALHARASAMFVNHPAACRLILQVRATSARAGLPVCHQMLPLSHHTGCLQCPSSNAVPSCKCMASAAWPRITLALPLSLPTSCISTGRAQSTERMRNSML